MAREISKQGWRNGEGENIDEAAFAIDKNRKLLASKYTNHCSGMILKFISKTAIFVLDPR